MKYKIDDIQNILNESGLIAVNDYIRIHGDKVYNQMTLINFISVLIGFILRIKNNGLVDDDEILKILNEKIEVAKNYE